MARNNVKLTTHLGTDIFVDDEVGKFSAKLSNGAAVEERTLSAVRRAIESDEPVVTVMEISGFWVGARQETLSRTAVNRIAMKHRITEDSDTIPEYAELDEAVIGELRELTQAEEAEAKEVRAKYVARKRGIIEAVPRITYGRINEMLEEDRQRKAARR